MFVSLVILYILFIVHDHSNIDARHRQLEDRIHELKMEVEKLKRRA